MQDSGYFPSILNLSFDGSTFNNRPLWCDTKPCDSDPKGCTYCLEFSLSEKWVIRWNDSGNRNDKVREIFLIFNFTLECDKKVLFTTYLGNLFIDKEFTVPFRDQSTRLVI